ncbi:hypothetical protein EVAR_65964_1 [Eumeta japonica]|uniref:Uncharacterized protein n=1 Tax=Eumeta variegata TaxID=151549 RepID=A0A4C1ZA23_EUMVA|nr:hypothetical protein EVAR_65964_1 [Eumeta japonica]
MAQFRDSVRPASRPPPARTRRPSRLSAGSTPTSRPSGADRGTNTRKIKSLISLSIIEMGMVFDRNWCIPTERFVRSIGMALVVKGETKAAGGMLEGSSHFLYHCQVPTHAEHLMKMDII